jgi:hypothetical protein
LSRTGRSSLGCSVAYLDGNFDGGAGTPCVTGRMDYCGENKLPHFPPGSGDYDMKSSSFPKADLRLTQRQLQILEHVEKCGPVDSGYDGSVLGLVTQHFNQAPGYVYYTWAAKQSFGHTKVCQKVTFLPI